ncbi:MAG: hypothetical protein R6V07_19325 [Armatimonadota bacterium]
MVQPNDIVIWAAAFVALWWVIDWLHMRQEGERLPMRRAPLRALGDVLPKLWRMCNQSITHQRATKAAAQMTMSFG